MPSLRTRAQSDRTVLVLVLVLVLVIVIVIVIVALCIESLRALSDFQFGMSLALPHLAFSALGNLQTRAILGLFP